MTKTTYAQAGVNLNKYERLLQTVKRQLRSLSKSRRIGHFAGIVELGGKSGSDGIIVASVDGVGTKIKVASEFGRHTGIGKDIVAHCVNDILCMGARPIAFLDYIAFESIDIRVFRQVMRGIASECSRLGIQLIGGETAEMPGVYREGEYDLAGFIIGLTSRRRMLDGSKISKGDLIVGLPSNGLHTNGYSLARRVLLEKGRRKVRKPLPVSWQSVGSLLLRPHTNYFDRVYPLVEKNLLAGVAHITGGGIGSNLARILPRGCAARLRKSLWRVPTVFNLIAESGPVDEDEMFRVFNMGLGMLLIASNSSLPEVMKHARSSRVVGEIVEGDGEVIIE